MTKKGSERDFSQANMDINNATFLKIIKKLLRSNCLLDFKMR